MPENKRKLYLFTAAFPYGNKSEPFLETEILLLSEKFEEVIIIPRSNTGVTTKRKTPKNVVINDCIIEGDFSKKSKLKALLSSLLVTLKLLLSELADKSIRIKLKPLLDYLSQQLIIKSIVSQINFSSSDIIYDYWFVDSTLGLTILKSENKIHSVICRAHRFDLYDDAYGPGGVPFRKWIMKNISSVYVISQSGSNYLKTKINPSLHHKVLVSRLGVNQSNLSSQFSKSDNRTIVSCSGVTERKQVLKIFDTLNGQKEQINWVHFGDGNLMDDLKLKVQNERNNNLEVTLRGHTDNSEVIEFYTKHKVDYFISMSLSEGIPVSMMEAISFGIPLISYSIGGIPEILMPNKTGHFLEQNDNEINDFQKALNIPLNTDDIIKFYSCNFNADKNYNDFIKKLCSLEK